MKLKSELCSTPPVPSQMLHINSLMLLPDEKNNWIVSKNDFFGWVEARYMKRREPKQVVSDSVHSISSESSHFMLNLSFRSSVLFYSLCCLR